MPKITIGRAGLCQPSPSMNQAKMAKTMKSRPAMKREKESVQSFLLMGSQAVQTRPAVSRRLPVTNSQTMRSGRSRRRRSNLSRQHTEQGRSDGRQRTDHALGIPGFGVRVVVGAQHEVRRCSGRSCLPRPGGPGRSPERGSASSSSNRPRTGRRIHRIWPRTPVYKKIAEAIR